MQVCELIEKKLKAAFNPLLLTVDDESHRHHHAPAGAQSHFKVVLVSEAFVGQSAVRRHQMVYRELVHELTGPVHALALHTLTAAEWRARTEKSFPSPPCQSTLK